MKKNLEKNKFLVITFLLNSFALHGKNIKELIELADEPHEQQKSVCSKKIEKTNAISNHNSEKDSCNKKPSVENSNQKKSQQKKTSEYFKVPLQQEKNHTTHKKNSSIPVTYLENSQKKCEKKPHKIFVTNEITENMITYHYFGARVPTKLFISFNDQEPVIVVQNKKIETVHNTPFALMPGNMLKAKVYYQFDVGGLIYRKGTKEITYKVNTPVEKITAQFSWHKPEKLIIKEAELITFKDI